MVGGKLQLYVANNNTRPWIATGSIIKEQIKWIIRKRKENTQMLAMCRKQVEIKFKSSENPQQIRKKNKYKKINMKNKHWNTKVQNFYWKIASNGANYFVFEIIWTNRKFVVFEAFAVGFTIFFFFWF